MNGTYIIDQQFGVTEVNRSGFKSGDLSREAKDMRTHSEGKFLGGFKTRESEDLRALGREESPSPQEIN